MENWRFSDKQLIVRYSLILLLVFTGNMFAQSGGSAGSFMSLANGARAFGMGGATIASSEDATTIFSNPGMVGMLYDGQFNATIARLAFDRNYYDLAFVYPLNSWGNIGLGWTQLSIDNIQGRDQYGYITQKFSDLQSAFILGYSKMIGDNFSIGLSGKYLYHSLAGYSAKGVSFDIGSAVYIGEKITLGAVF
ncbi:MAG: PorV/PorQ family protein, partial [Candidatus Marinimicrobia bacterium]|nr:PorV/PorQ family protein [Candidatus Neomarinimicrobiota bacterium]